MSLANPNALRKLLYVDFGNAEYPFGGAEVYGLEKLENSMHRNEKRLAWVRSKVKESEECDNSTAS